MKAGNYSPPPPPPLKKKENYLLDHWNGSEYTSEVMQARGFKKKKHLQASSWTLWWQWSVVCICSENQWTGLLYDRDLRSERVKGICCIYSHFMFTHFSRFPVKQPSAGFIALQPTIVSILLVIPKRFQADLLLDDSLTLKMKAYLSAHLQHMESFSNINQWIIAVKKSLGYS